MTMLKAVIFDLDGVVTKTAVVHANAWKSVFDDFLVSWSYRTGKPFDEFIYERDYLGFIDGKPRYQGVASFLQSRGIELPYGNISDSSETETVCGIGNRKSSAFMRLLKKDGVETFHSTVNFIHALKEKGIRIGLASSSKNAREVLAVTNLTTLFEIIVDGLEADKQGLKGKPNGDIFIHAATGLGVSPEEAVVVEDAESGVQAAVNANIAFIIGIARESNEAILRKCGAHIVVADISQLSAIQLVELFNNKFNTQE